jgi:hypothetical protein
MPDVRSNLKMNTHKVTGLGNGSASDDGAAFGQIPPLSSANPAALGTAAPGSSANVSRYDHVHPTTGLLLAADVSGGSAASVYLPAQVLSGGSASG